MKHHNILTVGSSAFLLGCLGLTACSGSDGGPLNTAGGTSSNSSASGGATSAGGNSSSSASTATGGSSSSSTSASGGSSASSQQGGSSNQGGSSAANGGTSTASSNDTSAKGGSASGGSSSSAAGGTSAKGGTSASNSSSVGGATAAGGTSASSNTNAGGTTTAGGSSSAGGSSAAGTTGDPDTDGKCGTTWSAGGASGAPALTATVTPTNASDVWTFTYGRYKFVVSAKTAGRIIEYSVGGKNIIYPSTQYGDSTFAPSPQSKYTMWPPPAELDSSAYTATMADNILSLVGKTNSELKLSFSKRFWVNAESGVVTLEYTIVNQATASATWAPWEITRVPAGGFTFAPAGPGTRTIALQSWETAMPMTTNGGINWLDYAAKSSSMTKENYIVEFDGTEGWLAHAQSISTTPLLFVKSFKDAQDSALPPDQGEIQLWTNGSASADPKRIEVEQQGEQKALAAGGKLTWTVNWSLCELPAANVLAVGNADLVKYAKAHAVKQ